MESNTGAWLIILGAIALAVAVFAQVLFTDNYGAVIWSALAASIALLYAYRVFRTFIRPYPAAIPAPAEDDAEAQG